MKAKVIILFFALLAVAPILAQTKGEKKVTDSKGNAGTYRGELKEGKMHGHGTLTYNTNAKAEGIFWNNSFIYGTLTKTNGDTFEGIVVDGVAYHGVVKDNTGNVRHYLDRGKTMQTPPKSVTTTAAPTKAKIEYNFKEDTAIVKGGDPNKTIKYTGFLMDNKEAFGYGKWEVKDKADKLLCIRYSFAESGGEKYRHSEITEIYGDKDSVSYNGKMFYPKALAEVSKGKKNNADSGDKTEVKDEFESGNPYLDTNKQVMGFYIGEYDKSQPKDGYGKVKYRKDSSIAEGLFIGGRIVEGTRKYKEGDYYVGSFKDDKHYNGILYDQQDKPIKYITDGKEKKITAKKTK